jgi:2-amino-4-hydroxy-6-hydroxymethyldihydropteridine diphosphokinase
LGDPLETCVRAVEALRGDRVFRALRCSSWYRTEPVGIAEQPWFVNLVVEATTSLTPRELLAYCRDLERALGRKHRLPGGPRELDMDLLLYGDLIRDEPDLVIPHPRLHERRFVLEPLAEIAPWVVHPALGFSTQQLLQQCQDTHRVERRCQVPTTSPLKVPSA